jgi:hypothetical protein
MTVLCNVFKKSGSRLFQRIVWCYQVQGRYPPQQKNRETEIKLVDLTRMLLYKINSFEPLAQSVEHLTFNQVVVGSTPTRLTKHYQGVTQKRDSLFCFKSSLCILSRILQGAKLENQLPLRPILD